MPTRQTFIWNPDRGSALASKPSVQATKFGDGYEARIPVGINSNAEVWSLSFSLSLPNSLEAHDFLKARNATESFIWVNPHGKTNYYVCREWKITGNGGFRMLSCDFEQVFEF